MDYTLFDNRFNSFKSKDPATNKSKKAWPHRTAAKHKFLSALYVSNVGFIHTPSKVISDLVTCFACKKECNWSLTHEHPIAYHLDNSPCWNVKIWGLVAKNREILSGLNVELDLEEYKKLLKISYDAYAKKWPFPDSEGKGPTVSDMVLAGFYFIPESHTKDSTMCPFCEIEIDEWEPTDDPLSEHLERGPKCRYFRLATEKTSKKVKEPVVAHPESDIEEHSDNNLEISDKSSVDKFIENALYENSMQSPEKVLEKPVEKPKSKQTRQKMKQVLPTDPRAVAPKLASKRKGVTVVGSGNPTLVAASSKYPKDNSNSKKQKLIKKEKTKAERPIQESKSAPKKMPNLIKKLPNFKKRPRTSEDEVYVEEEIVEEHIVKRTEFEDGEIPSDEEMQETPKIDENPTLNGDNSQSTEFDLDDTGTKRVESEPNQNKLNNNTLVMDNDYEEKRKQLENPKRFREMNEISVEVSPIVSKDLSEKSNEVVTSTSIQTAVYESDDSERTKTIEKTNSQLENVQSPIQREESIEKTVNNVVKEAQLNQLPNASNFFKDISNRTEISLIELNALYDQNKDLSLKSFMSLLADRNAAVFDLHCEEMLANIEK